MPARELGHDVWRRSGHDEGMRGDLSTAPASLEEQVAQARVACTHAVDTRENIPGVVLTFDGGGVGG